MTKHGPYFWDSCIIVSLLNCESCLDLSVVREYLSQASDRRCEIYVSTLSRVEITPNLRPKPSMLEEIDKLWRELEGSVTVVSPNPEIMRYASVLRCVPFKKSGSNRNLGVGDSVLLATALWLQDMGIALKFFHTNDKGKKTNSEGSKDVPLIGFAEWVAEPLESLEDKLGLVVERICNLNPSLPQPLEDLPSSLLVQGSLYDHLNMTIS
jgi:predicted nucleic acid-binding protein